MAWAMTVAAAAKAVEPAPSPVPRQSESDPEIFSSCGDLRRATADLNAEDEKRLELSVTGPLTMVEFDGALAYLAVCAAPNPQVLCIAYGSNGLKVGDSVVLSGGLGGYARPDADHILLDPCLPSPPQR